MSYTDRVVVLVDMDCFYCQVEENLNPDFKGKPLAVVQYNAWRGGGIIAVNYPARKRGVTRHMRGDEAKKKCPDIELVRVPTIRGKADLSKYRDAGKSVAKVLQTFTPLLERASVDEAYLDITEAVDDRMRCSVKEIALSQIRNTHVVGCETIEFLYSLYNSGLHMESNLKLAYGGVIAEEIRAAVFEQTGYTCSAGIAHNKILAKLTCGLNKPNKQTILPQDSIEGLYKDLPVQKIRSLGGKFGNSLSEELGIKFMADLLKFSEKELKKHFDEKTGLWLYNIARGIDLEPVTTRLVSKSIGCCKKFPGRSALIAANSVNHWLNELALEIAERLEKDLEENNRKARQMVVSFSQEVHGEDVASSRTIALSSYDSTRIATDALEVLKKYCLQPSGTYCLKFLGISAGKFEDCRNVNEITSFFKVDTNKGDTKQGCCSKSKVDTCNIASYFVSRSKELDQSCTPVADSHDSQSEIPLTNYSDTTEELDEDSSDFIFLNENVTEEAGNVSDSDSITNELCDNSNELHELQPQKESFFLRYFENMKNQKCQSPVARDFDTSRNLEEDIGDEESDEDTIPERREELENKNLAIPSTSCTTTTAHDAPSTSRDVFEFEDTIEVCKVCNQKLLKSEMVSHMDYHLALQIVREEAHLYKNNTKPVQMPKHSKETNKKSLKRKSSEIDKNTTLETFLKSNTDDETTSLRNAKICPECNKKIDKASFESHLDYHAARKLHLEINRVKTCGAESLKKGKKPGRTKDVKTPKETLTSVRDFFKVL